MDKTRTQKLEIKLTEKEKQQIKKLAQQHRLDMASYSRMKILAPLREKEKVTA